MNVGSGSCARLNGDADRETVDGRLKEAVRDPPTRSVAGSDAFGDAVGDRVGSGETVAVADGLEWIEYGEIGTPVPSEYEVAKVRPRGVASGQRVAQGVASLGIVSGSSVPGPTVESREAYRITVGDMLLREGAKPA
jgi:hypothetical protein